MATTATTTTTTTPTARIDWEHARDLLDQMTALSGFDLVEMAGMISPSAMVPLPAPPRPDAERYILPDDLAERLLSALTEGGAEAGVLARFEQLPGTVAIWVQDIHGSRWDPYTNLEKGAVALLTAALRGGAPAVAAALALPCRPD